MSNLFLFIKTVNPYFKYSAHYICILFSFIPYVSVETQFRKLFMKALKSLTDVSKSGARSVPFPEFVPFRPSDFV